MGTVVGTLITRTIVFGGLYLGSLYFGRLPTLNPKPKKQGRISEFVITVTRIHGPGVYRLKDQAPPSPS